MIFPSSQIIHIIFSERCKKIKIRTEDWGYENSYDLGVPECVSKQQYGSHKNYEEECCMDRNLVYVVCKCSYGDGWHGGYLEINGVKYCDDFRSGYKKMELVEWIPFLQ